MNIAEFSIRKKTVILVLTALALVGGVLAYQNLPRLEDPEFTIKEALIYTPYPGATPPEVEEEVTNEIEKALQQLGQLKRVESKSERGLSTVTAVIKDKYDKRSLPQVWDELRRKVDDMQGNLPPGAGPSTVFDDYGDIYGVYFAVTGDGYSYEEIRRFADLLKRELLLIQDVKKIELYGLQPEVVYVEMSRQKMSQLGISQEEIFAALQEKNIVADAGRVKVGPEYIAIDPTGAFESIKEMEDLLISSASTERLIYLKDVATVRRGYVDPPGTMLRLDGKPAIGLAISTVQGGNVVTMGQAIAERLNELKTQTPVGMELGVIALQSEAVTKAIDGFVINLIEAVVIVIVVLLIFMGLRSGLIIGFVLFLTICATFVVMASYSITLERISLGALIIALGMLVDNAIVVTDGILVRVEGGQDRIQAAGEVVKKSMFPLLGATVVAIFAFAAIGTSQDSTGEYCRSLFQVIMISLSMSWVTAVTVTPLLCVTFLKPKPPEKRPAEPYGGAIFQRYRRTLRFFLRWRRLACVGMIALLALAIYGFGYVENSFFPNSSRPQFMVDCWLPMGTHITETVQEAERLEKYLMGLDNVEHVASFIGQGASRFLLTYSPEKPDSGYAMLLVTVEDYREIDRMLQAIEKHLDENYPRLLTKVKKFLLGPGGGGKIQVRFSGPDPEKLRELAGRTTDILHADGGARTIRTDWRQRVKLLRPQFSEAQASRTGISRPQLASALKAAFAGATAGVYRERDRLLPIIARSPEAEREDVDNIKDIQIWSPVARKAIPLGQVVGGFKTVYEDPVIQRRNRKRTITIHCDQKKGNASVVFERIRPKIEAIELPAGYEMAWGGEYEDATEAQKALAGSIPLFVLLMILVVICLFNALRQPLIIWLCVPMAIIGVTAGLLVTGQPFGFMALLGLLSLTGMLIKNSIVLIDEIDFQIADGKEKSQAIMDSAVSRMRPVMMAAVTTIFGMAPLLQDPFFVALAVTVMVGLGFATVLTLIVVPVLYSIFFRVPVRP